MNNVSNLTIDSLNLLIDQSKEMLASNLNLYSLLNNLSTNLHALNSSLNTPPIDPNWFYSSAAQSAATAIGIIIAFLTTWIISISLRRKQLIDDISTETHEKESIIKEIVPLKEWMKKIDLDDERKEVLEFLDSIKEKITPDKPQPVEEIYDLAKQSDREINLSLLKQEYSEEYITEAIKFQRTPPILRLVTSIRPSMIISETYNLRQWDQYKEYRDYVQKQEIKIEYLNKIILYKEKELSETKILDILKKSFFWILLLSVALIFYPLGMMLSNYDIMMNWRWAVFIPFLFGWIIICYSIWRIIQSLSN